jgi:class 3 adenylate cyclase
MDARIDERALDEHLAALEAARPWSPRTISRLETLVRTGDDEAVFRVNPIKFAAERGMAEAETIDLFLHAAAVGLFAMDWLLLCPLCSCVVGSFGSLRAVDNHYHCSMCQTDYEAKLDDYIAVTFTVASTIRRIAFHAPAGLPARDYVVKYRVTGPHLAGRTPDGLIWGDLADQLTRVVSYLPPGETVQLEVIASGGFLLGYDTDSDAGFVIAIAGEATAELQTVRLDYLDGRCEPAGGKVRPGLVVIEITNTTTRRGLIAVAELPADFARCRLTYEPFLTAARLLTTQTFRDLFRAEVIRATEGIGVKDITLLFTDLKGSTALYEWIGDLNALALVQRHFERLRDATVRHGGTTIKTIGDAVMAAFQDPADAVRAALAMLAEVEALNRGIGEQELILKIGLHKGAAIAVTHNDRLDYFGQTVNVAARVQALADAGEIYLTREVHDAPGVAALLAPITVEAGTARLKGVGQETPVFRVQSRTATRAA